MEKTSRIVAGAGLLAGSGRVLAKSAAAKSRVVEVVHPGAVSGDRRVSEPAVHKMVSEGLKALTGKENPFDGLIGPSDRVGLKINCLGRPLIYTHHEVARVFSRQLQGIGVKPENIIVWDRFDKHMTDSGYELNTSGKGVCCCSTESYDGEGRFDPESSYRSANDNPLMREEGGEVSRMSEIFTRKCDKVINLAILKDHGLSGVTLCLKNLAFGLCDNNRRFHGREHIGPFIAEFCARKDVRDKVVLHVIDGLEGCYDQGPKPGSVATIFTHDTLWLSRDPVALDVLGTAVIEARRKENGLRSLKEVGRPPRHIELAAAKGVGVNVTERMDVRKVRL